MKIYSLSTLTLFMGIVYGQIDPSNIDIVRDSYGVPHIFAPTDAEVAYGLSTVTNRIQSLAIQL